MQTISKKVLFRLFGFTNDFLIKYDSLEYVNILGLTYGFKWNTNNMAEADIKIEDEPIQGMSGAAQLQFVPLTG